ncbi:MAG: sugar diacid recognition domain-containing protein, partial [Culicoidibacterales bacterium]
MLTPSLAQEIAEKMMEVVPYNINIMDKNGVILASGDE